MCHYFKQFCSENHLLTYYFVSKIPGRHPLSIRFNRRYTNIALISRFLNFSLKRRQKRFYDFGRKIRKQSILTRDCWSHEVCGRWPIKVFLTPATSLALSNENVCNSRHISRQLRSSHQSDKERKKGKREENFFLNVS